MADAWSQSSAQVFVGLRQDLVFKVVELHTPLAMLVDDTFKQLSFFHSNHFEVTIELILQLNLGYVAISVLVKFVES